MRTPRQLFWMAGTCALVAWLIYSSMEFSRLRTQLARERERAQSARQRAEAEMEDLAVQLERAERMLGFQPGSKRLVPMNPAPMNRPQRYPVVINSVPQTHVVPVRIQSSERAHGFDVPSRGYREQVESMERLLDKTLPHRLDRANSPEPSQWSSSGSQRSPR